MGERDDSVPRSGGFASNSAPPDLDSSHPLSRFGDNTQHALANYRRQQLRRKAARQAAQVSQPPAVSEAIAARGLTGASAPFPHRDAIESSFGQPLAASAHTDAAAAADALGADAYAYGNQVGFASAQPSLFVAAHEAAHTLQDAGAVQRHGGATDGDAYEAHADAVAARVVAGQSAADLLGHAGGPATVRRYADDKHYDTPQTGKRDSARFEGDPQLEAISAGTGSIKEGAHGLEVTKMQQALIDLGYLLAHYGVDGIFGPETRLALTKFQHDHALAERGTLDQATMSALHTAYDTRKPYVDAAALDPVHPGTRALSAADRKGALAAMVPTVGASGAPPVFTDEVAGKKYGDEIGDALTKIVSQFHKELFDDKVGLRADPAKNFHDWSTLEGPGAAAKQVVDAMYDTNYGGALAFPAMTHAGGNLIDQWEDEEQRNAVLTPGQKKDKATDKVWYLVNSNCSDVNHKHGAVPSAATEKAILTPIVDSFVADATKVQRLLELDIGWEGAQLQGTVYLQRFKSVNPDKDAAKEENRVQMWGLFQTCIHEYIHTLAHAKYQQWAQTFKDKGDDTRYNTLIEGFCDFFTLNVRSTLAPDPALRTKIEGPYANGKAPAKDSSGVYPSHAQAEQVVSIVGIKNAQAGYFQGKTKLMGDA